MKLSSLILVLASAIAASASPVNNTLVKRAAPKGIDVSHYQGNVDFKKAKANGITFTYIKATEGTSRSPNIVLNTRNPTVLRLAFIDPNFSNNYISATNAGIIRGGYHFAHPDISSGATQAKYFIAHGGGWSSDGITLPGALDIECKPLPHSYPHITGLTNYINHIICRRRQVRVLRTECIGHGLLDQRLFQHLSFIRRCLPRYRIYLLNLTWSTPLLTKV